MAKIVLVAGCSHSPYLFTPPERWAESRARRPIRADVPEDSPAVNKAKHAQCLAAFARVRAKVAEVKPDVLLIFGDDQLEQFNFTNFPAFGLYLGEDVEGPHPIEGYARRVLFQEGGESTVCAKGHPELGKRLIEGLFDRDFEVAFSLDRPNKERGIGHAFMNPPFYLTPNYDIPILPFWMNCYYPPQPSGKRCYQLGKAVRQVIEEMPLDLRVAVVGSGGLWHTPGAPNAYLDEEFDQRIVAHLKTGNVKGAAEYFDTVPWSYPTERPTEGPGAHEWTGMAGGAGNGTGETRAWLTAAAVVDGQAPSFLEYVPVYASPIGVGVAYWEMD